MTRINELIEMLHLNGYSQEQTVHVVRGSKQVGDVKLTAYYDSEKEALKLVVKGEKFSTIYGKMKHGDSTTIELVRCDVNVGDLGGLEADILAVLRLL